MPGETVYVDVLGPNGYVSACLGTVSLEPLDNGLWSCQVILAESELAEGTYTFTAMGRDSSFTESGSFTDSDHFTGTWNASFGGSCAMCTPQNAAVFGQRS